jgi:hypothetical protein
MRHIIFISIVLIVFTSCASQRCVYEINYTEELDFTAELLTIHFVSVKNKEAFNWEVYQTTSAYKELHQKAQVICYDYWGTYKEWKKLNKKAHNKTLLDDL